MHFETSPENGDGPREDRAQTKSWSNTSAWSTWRLGGGERFVVVSSKSPSRGLPLFATAEDAAAGVNALPALSWVPSGTVVVLLSSGSESASAAQGTVAPTATRRGGAYLLDAPAQYRGLYAAASMSTTTGVARSSLEGQLDDFVVSDRVALMPLDDAWPLEVLAHSDFAAIAAGCSTSAEEPWLFPRGAFLRSMRFCPFERALAQGLLQPLKAVQRKATALDYQAAGQRGVLLPQPLRVSSLSSRNLSVMPKQLCFVCLDPTLSLSRLTDRDACKSYEAVCSFLETRPGISHIWLSFSCCPSAAAEQRSAAAMLSALLASDVLLFLPNVRLTERRLAQTWRRIPAMAGGGAQIAAGATRRLQSRAEEESCVRPQAAAAPAAAAAAAVANATALSEVSEANERLESSSKGSSGAAAASKLASPAPGGNGAAHPLLRLFQHLFRASGSQNAPHESGAAAPFAPVVPGPPAAPEAAAYLLDVVVGGRKACVVFKVLYAVERSSEASSASTPSVGRVQEQPASRRRTLRKRSSSSLAPPIVKPPVAQAAVSESGVSLPPPTTSAGTRRRSSLARKLAAMLGENVRVRESRDASGGAAPPLPQVVLVVYDPAGREPPHHLRVRQSILRALGLDNLLAAELAAEQKSARCSTFRGSRARSSAQISPVLVWSDVPSSQLFTEGLTPRRLSSGLAAALRIDDAGQLTVGADSQISWDELPSLMRLEAPAAVTGAAMHCSCRAVLAAASVVSHNLEVVFRVEALSTSVFQGLRLDKGASFEDAHEALLLLLLQAERASPSPSPNPKASRSRHQVTRRSSCGEEVARQPSGGGGGWPEPLLLLKSLTGAVSPGTAIHDSSKPLFAAARGALLSSALAAHLLAIDLGEEGQDLRADDSAAPQDVLSAGGAAPAPREASAACLADWGALLRLCGDVSEEGSCVRGPSAASAAVAVGSGHSDGEAQCAMLFPSLDAAVTEISGIFCSPASDARDASKLATGVEPTNDEASGAAPLPIVARSPSGNAAAVRSSSSNAEAAEEKNESNADMMRALFVLAGFRLLLLGPAVPPLEIPGFLADTCRDGFHISLVKRIVTGVDLNRLSDEAFLQGLEITRVTFKSSPIAGGTVAKFVLQLRSVEMLLLDRSLEYGTSLLAQRLSNNSNLCRLHVINTPLTPSECGALAQLTQTTRLQELDLSGSGAGDQGAQLVASAVRDSGLRRLLLKNCEIGDAGAAAVADAASLSRGLAIDLSDNPLISEKVAQVWQEYSICDEAQEDSAEDFDGSVTGSGGPPRAGDIEQRSVSKKKSAKAHNEQQVAPSEPRAPSSPRARRIVALRAMQMASPWRPQAEESFGSAGARAAAGLGVGSRGSGKGSGSARLSGIARLSGSGHGTQPSRQATPRHLTPPARGSTSTTASEMPPQGQIQTRGPTQP